MFKTAFILLALAAAAFFLMPYYTVQQLTKALENEDMAQVDQYVDFDAVKASFNSDFAQSMNLQDEAGASIGAVLATGIASAFINTMVSPDMMVSVLKDKTRRDRIGLGTDVKDLLARGSWQDAGHFVVYNNDGKPTMLLTRTGLHWHLTALSLR